MASAELGFYGKMAHSLAREVLHFHVLLWSP